MSSDAKRIYSETNVLFMARICLTHFLWNFIKLVRHVSSLHVNCIYQANMYVICDFYFMFLLSLAKHIDIISILKAPFLRCVNSISGRHQSMFTLRQRTVSIFPKGLTLCRILIVFTLMPVSQISQIKSKILTKHMPFAVWKKEGKQLKENDTAEFKS